MPATAVLDAALDRTLVLGYTKIGPALRRRWWPADPEPGSMHGKRVVVTGATSGIGEAMAVSFAELGATVHLLGRSADKVARYAGRLRQAVPSAEVVEEVCDIGDLDAVRAWCADLTGRVDALHGIVHNAGVMPPRRAETPQGHELALAAHVLGPHLMTELLLPVLGAARGSSVVFMSSGGMYGARLRDGADEIEFRDGEYDGVQAYARTKRMQVVLAEAWAGRLRGGQVRAESMHPGWVATAGVSESLPRFNKVMGPLLRDPASGADTAVWLVATRPESAGTSHFWHDRRLRPTTYGWQRGEDHVKVRRFLSYVAGATDTSAAW
jgi:dehydrogenase/reductase SDR family protein 12